MNIEERLMELPACAGVYIMKNFKGEVIYIGKAKQLNRRVRSYFDGKDKNNHRAAEFMVPHIRDIEWIITETEMNALILEANLIQKYKPLYNVRQKDDKHFPYLMLSIREKFPRLRVVRRVENDGNLYFGPFLNSRYMRMVLDMVPQMFHLRGCNLKFPLNKVVKPCLNFHIGRCGAPCANGISEEKYDVQVRETRALLEGKNDFLLAKWQREMQTAAAEMRFEDAGRLRDKVQSVMSSFVKQTADSACSELSLDVISVCSADDLACVVIFEYRNGALSDRRDFTLENCLKKDEPEILSEFLPIMYLNENPENLPREVVLEYSLGEETEVFEELLAKHSNHKVVCTVPMRGDKSRYLRIAKANAEMLLVERKAKNAKFNDINRSIFELQKELRLSSPPFAFECFDVSHLGGTQPVASMVRFRNGKPEKSEYRKYIIKVAEGGDDYGSLREVLTRRINYLRSENMEMPDLFVMDGGKGQVEAAFGVLKEFGLEEIPVIGLAKRLEEIVFPGERASVLLKRSNPALKLLQQARDEAHRFAITFQRHRRSMAFRK